VSGRSLVDGRAGTVDPCDRGLQYGDGLFETMALVDGRVRRLELHMARLEEGCARLGIAFPGKEAVLSDISQLAAHPVAGTGRRVVKIIVTRGAGGRGYRGEDGKSTRIASVHAWPDTPTDWASQGVVIRLCALTLADQPILAGLKHLNRLEQVLARREWHDELIAEGLLRNPRGHVVCGTMSNLFAASAGRLLTPRLDRSGVAGTVRAWILEWARRAAVPCEEIELNVEDLLRADEVFLTNAIVGLWPVTRLDDRQWPGQWPVGPLARRLLEALDRPCAWS
jgi:4-amino-4-deoxychorismate lyase